jgi:hypothetical protein
MATNIESPSPASHGVKTKEITQNILHDLGLPPGGCAKTGFEMARCTQAYISTNPYARGGAGSFMTRKNDRTRTSSEIPG